MVDEVGCYYCDLEIDKDVKLEEGERGLERWFEGDKENVAGMSWFEFWGCGG
ncbi:DUF2600 family protein [Bacillus mycoides]|uniref:DUF2600 family protein n=1 Tax=Bacillus mycoides TaxID=1405 RepID=UPI002356C862|nr:DUF2600 family protein [Bacillus mycoides]